MWNLSRLAFPGFLWLVWQSSFHKTHFCIVKLGFFLEVEINAECLTLHTEELLESWFEVIDFFKDKSILVAINTFIITFD